MGGASNGNATAGHGCVAQATQSSFDQISWTIAISLAILAAVSNNLGVNLQKLAWTKKQNNGKQRTYRLIWIVGMLGIILASVFDFVALAFGPQSVIAPLGSLTMVMNGCVAPFMHGEKVRRKVIWITFVIVAGCAMAVATASHANVICDLDGIFGYFRSFTFLGYALVILFITAVVVLLIRRAEAVVTTYGEDSPQYDRIFKYHRVSYAFIAGLYGAQSVVFARAIGQSVMSSTRGGELFLVRWETWLILLGLILSIVVQMVYLNKGLSRFESTYNVPVFTGTFIVGTAVSGGVVYGEFNGFSQLQAALFPLGVCLCVLGVFALAWTNDEEEPEVANEADLEQPSELPHLPALPPSGPASSLAVSTSLAAANPDYPPPVYPRRGSLRLASGGFTPFVIGVGPEEHSHIIRKSRRASQNTPHAAHHHHHHHGIDLLTGLRVDDLTPKAADLPRVGSGSFFPSSNARGSGEFFTGTRNNRNPASKPNTPRSSGLDDQHTKKTKTPKTSALEEHELSRPITPTGGASNAEKNEFRTGPQGSGLSQLKKPLTPQNNGPKPPPGF